MRAVFPSGIPQESEISGRKSKKLLNVSAQLWGEWKGGFFWVWPQGLRVGEKGEGRRKRGTESDVTINNGKELQATGQRGKKAFLLSNTFSSFPPKGTVSQKTPGKEDITNPMVCPVVGKGKKRTTGNRTIKKMKRTIERRREALIVVHCRGGGGVT